LLRHGELNALSIAHLDCDAFYASIEKRDDPTLRDKPVIVGGGRRGVVSAACYVARRYGVRSAMPMFKALKACPNAVVIPPNMEKYATVGRAVREILRSYTPLVEPLSLDEAFLDLSGTERLHGGAPAQTMLRIVKRIEDEVHITASVGLSYNKFLAKIASDLDKPRGFAVIGRAEAVAFLAQQPVGLLWGAGKALQRRLASEGITMIGQLQQMAPEDLIARYGAMGRRMAMFVRGQDDRRVDPSAPTKSISSETTFDTDIADEEPLRRALWRQSEIVARRMKAQHLAGHTVTLKLRTADFQRLTRSQRLPNPTQLANVIFQYASALLHGEINGTRYRLLGVGLSQLASDEHADPLDLADPDAGRRADAERALDQVRSQFGDKAIFRGLALPDERAAKGAAGQRPQSASGSSSRSTNRPAKRVDP
jgi:DNA polymerase-4